MRAGLRGSSSYMPLNTMMAWLLEARGELQAAYEHLESAVKSEPTVDVRLQVASTLLQHKDLSVKMRREEVEHFANGVLEDVPGHPTALAVKKALRRRVWPGIKGAFREHVAYNVPPKYDMELKSEDTDWAYLLPMSLARARAVCLLELAHRGCVGFSVESSADDHGLHMVYFKKLVPPPLVGGADAVGWLSFSMQLSEEKKEKESAEAGTDEEEFRDTLGDNFDEPALRQDGEQASQAPSSKGLRATLAEIGVSEVESMCDSSPCSASSPG